MPCSTSRPMRSVRWKPPSKDNTNSETELLLPGVLVPSSTVQLSSRAQGSLLLKVKTRLYLIYRLL
jgi:hypothetical protein